MSYRVCFEQFSHAAPLWVFQLWAWSFTFIIGFGIFQVFLALLIEGLARASKETTMTRTVPDEVSTIVQERIKRCVLSSYMPDNTLRSRMQARKAGLPSSKYLRDIICSHIQIQNIKELSAILLPGGLFMSVNDIKDMFDASDAIIRVSFQPLVSHSSSVGQELAQPTIAPEDEVLASEIAKSNKTRLVLDIIDRFLYDSEASHADDPSTLVQILKLEDLVRNLVMFKGHCALMEHTEQMGRVLVPMAKKLLSVEEYFNFVKNFKGNDGISKSKKIGKLDITVVGAESLPNMDMIRSADAYCVLFTSPAAVQKLGIQCSATRTKVIRNNPSPQWMETFSLDVSPEDGYFIITIFDSDNMTADDLIGCVVVSLFDLRAGEAVDNWFDIQLKTSSFGGNGRPRLHLKLQFIPQYFSEDSG
jgi:hypothetical protein